MLLPAPEIADPLAGRRKTLAIGDWNRDGKADLAIRDDLMRVRLFSGLGDGSFGSEIEIPATGYSQGLGNVLALDVDSDGDEDLVLADDEMIGLVLNESRVMPRTADVGVTIEGPPTRVKPTDLVRFSVTVSNNGPEAAPHVVLTSAVPSGLTFAVDPARPECVVWDDTVTCALGAMAAGGSATLSLEYGATISAGRIALSVVAAAPGVTDPVPANNAASATADIGRIMRRDLNGDGRSDIVWRKAGGPDSGALFLWLMDGRSVVGATYLDPISTDWQIQAIADFSGDGKADILWRNLNPAAPDAGKLYLWLMDGPKVIGGTGYTNAQADLGWQVQRR
jgi:uncharacterized repeat protein (TIGR01451 family)